MIAWLLIAAVLTRLPAIDLATVRQLHETKIKPASEVVFNLGRNAPKSDAEWIAVSRAGITLTESGKLLMLAPRASADKKWTALSRQLTAAGRTATRAARARNLSALMRASDRLVTVCETCHAPYRNQTGKL